jgi:phage shock protein E
MNWILPLAVIAVLVVILFLKNSHSAAKSTAATANGAAQSSTDMFRTYIAAGAKVIDVREPDEYQDRHLPGTTNIPLGEIESKIVEFAPDSSTVLLLHCRSGRRSGSAVETLKRMGYTEVYNLGSYSEAQNVITGPK